MNKCVLLYQRSAPTAVSNNSAYVILTADSNGTATATITGYQTFVNANRNQIELAALNLATTINVTNVSCNKND